MRCPVAPRRLEESTAATWTTDAWCGIRLVPVRPPARRARPWLVLEKRVTMIGRDHGPRSEEPNAPEIDAGYGALRTRHHRAIVSAVTGSVWVIVAAVVFLVAGVLMLYQVGKSLP